MNKESRRGRAWAAQVRAALEGKVLRVENPRDAADFQRIIKRGIDEGVKEIWVGGGDGTIRQAAKGLLDTDVVLGILPMGTGNSLANELGIPAHPQKMVDFLLNEAAPKRIDVGQFNDEVFVNVATLGLTVQIAREIRSGNKKLLGRLVYLPAIWKAASATRAVSVTLSCDKGSYKGNILQFVAASGRTHGGPFSVTPDASITDGLLSVYVLKRGLPGGLLRYGWALMRGTHTDLDNVWSVETDKLTIELNWPRSFVLDGDLIMAQKAVISVHPQALTVLAGTLAEAESTVQS